MNAPVRHLALRRASTPRLISLAWRAFGVLVCLAEFSLVVSLSIACGVAYHLAVYGQAGDIRHHLAIGAAVAFLFVTTCAYWGHYQLRGYISAASSVRRPLGAWSLSFLYALALGFAAKVGAEFSRGNVILLYFVGAAGLPLWRAALVQLITQASRAGQIAARRVLLVGDRESVSSFKARYRPRNLGFEIVGEALLQSDESFERDVERAALAGRTLQPDDVFVLIPWSRTRAIERLVEQLLTLPVSIHLGPERILDRYTKVHIMQISSMATLCLVRPPLSPFEVLTKRLFDVTAAAIGLLLLMPLFAAIALLIRLDSPGPVLFRQQRYGFNQKPFLIFKFRTMAVHDDREVRQATRNDARVTRVGRFLRRWNIDELPQLINVLKGDMSLVGPRPHAVPHNQAFERRIDLYARRHNVKPGITGWAQVNGLRGETDTDEKMRRRLEADLYYIDNWSLVFDLRIIALTLFSRKAYRNAY